MKQKTIVSNSLKNFRKKCWVRNWTIISEIFFRKRVLFKKWSYESKLKFRRNSRFNYTEGLIRLVIGRSRESKHALTSHVGIMSGGHEELEEFRIADLTSDIVAKEKLGNSDKVTELFNDIKFHVYNYLKIRHLVTQVNILSLILELAIEGLYLVSDVNLSDWVEPFLDRVALV